MYKQPNVDLLAKTLEIFKLRSISSGQAMEKLNCLPVRSVTQPLKETAKIIYSQTLLHESAVNSLQRPRSDSLMTGNKRKDFEL